MALPVPRLGLLTYTVPDGATLTPGVRVSVPLGRRTATGFVVALNPPLDAAIDAANLKPILASSTRRRWCRRRPSRWRAGSPGLRRRPGETLALTLPPAARGRDRAFKTARVATLTPAATRGHGRGRPASGRRSPR